MVLMPSLQGNFKCASIEGVKSTWQWTAGPTMPPLIWVPSPFPIDEDQYVLYFHKT